MIILLMYSCVSCVSIYTIIHLHMIYKIYVENGHRPFLCICNWVEKGQDPILGIPAKLNPTDPMRACITLYKSHMLDTQPESGNFSICHVIFSPEFPHVSLGLDLNKCRHLFGGIPTPLKNHSHFGLLLPIYREKTSCPKPPTRINQTFFFMRPACLQNESMSRELSLNLGAANHSSSNQTCAVKVC